MNCTCNPETKTFCSIGHALYTAWQQAGKAYGASLSWADWHKVTRAHNLYLKHLAAGKVA